MISRAYTRIPVFAPLLGTEEVPLPVFVGIMFDRHWVAHTEQLAKVRGAAGARRCRRRSRRWIS